MKVAVAMAHGHATKWLQTIIYSIKNHYTDIDFDIFVAHTWPGHPSIEALTKTDLGNDVHVIDTKRRMQSHAIGLDEILDEIEFESYDWMLTLDTDSKVASDGWLDWFVSHINSDKVGMVGFFWHEGNHHYNIHPAGALYRKDMLLKYHHEVRNDNRPTFCHVDGCVLDREFGLDEEIKEVAGVFSETRGIRPDQMSELQEHYIRGGVPAIAAWEPGQYLFVRSVDEFSHRSVPCDHVMMEVNGHNLPEATYFGSRMNPYLIHYWGGTRAWDHLKHPVEDPFVRDLSPFWIDKEDYIWRNTVPERYHGVVHEIYKKLGI